MTQNSQIRYSNVSAEDDVSPMSESALSSSVSKTENITVRTAARNEYDHIVDNGEKESPPIAYLKPATIRLPRQFYIQTLVLVYSVMFVTGWIILAITSQRPIGRKSYYCDKSSFEDCYSESLAQKVNSRTQSYISNAQTLLSAVSILSIPLTSAVCAAAVIPWLQHGGRDVSLRQLLTLADRGWTSPWVYPKLLTYSGWRRYGSSFMALALLLHDLGAGLSPAISKLSRSVSIKVPTTSISIQNIMTVENIIENGQYLQAESTMRLRDSLRTVSPYEFQPRLWQQHVLNCIADLVKEAQSSGFLGNKRNHTADQCLRGGLNYAVLPFLANPFISQLPNGFNTGVDVNQAIPRINSSVNVTEIGQLPTECHSDRAVLSIHLSGSGSEEYTNDTTNQTQNMVDRKWAIQACVIDYGSASRFSNTSGPQTITEVLYLDLYAFTIPASDYTAVAGKYRIEINTTLGYFELPNYKRGNVAGDLMMTPYLIPATRYKKRSWYDDHNYGDESRFGMMYLMAENNASLPTRDLELLGNKGPLLNIAYALFGNGSYPSTFIHSNTTYNTGYLTDPELDVSVCRDIVPVTRLADKFYTGNETKYIGRTGCLSDYKLLMRAGIFNFVDNLVLPPDDLAKVFLAASYMSHEIMLNAGDYAYTGGITVQYDTGVDFQKPGLSRHAIIILSLAIALFLLCLIILSTYAGRSRSWTPSLDAYAMLRIGADLGSEAIPFYATNDPDQIVEMDDLPGFVGDVTSEDSEFGILGLGVGSRYHQRDRPRLIEKKRRFRSNPRLGSGLWQLDFLVVRIFSLNGRRKTNAAEWCKKLRERWERSHFF